MLVVAFISEKRLAPGLRLMPTGNWLYVALAKRHHIAPSQQQSQHPTKLFRRLQTRLFFLEVFCTERCHICIEKRDETDQEKKYEWVRRLDAKMKVMNECQIGLC